MTPNPKDRIGAMRDFYPVERRPFVDAIKIANAMIANLLHLTPGQEAGNREHQAGRQCVRVDTDGPPDPTADTSSQKATMTTKTYLHAESHLPIVVDAGQITGLRLHRQVNPDGNFQRLHMSLDMDDGTSFLVVPTVEVIETMGGADKVGHYALTGQMLPKRQDVPITTT